MHTKSSNNLSPWLPLLVFTLGLSVVLWVYSFAWTGSLMFDDEANLQQLSSVFANGQFDSFQALAFINGGAAGPLGRPLALVSFLLDGSAWGIEVYPFIYSNTLLHIINSLVLSLILLRLGRILGWSPHKTTWIALLTSLLWVSLPLLASSSLMIVQRMTLLSSLFMLLGLWAYLLARTQLEQRPFMAMLGMGFAIGVGGILGVLSKEQAALLPLLIGVLELTLLPRFLAPTKFMRGAWLSFRILFFVVPGLVILGYLGYIAFQGDSLYTLRNFSMSERLWSEAVILWRYVFLAFFPQASAFSPFHENMPFSVFSPLTLTAALAWLILLTLALLKRSQWKLFAFAVLWFLGAHVLESTVIPLELYFEHRNYLAVIGLFFAAIAGLWTIAESYQRTALFKVVFTAYFALQTFVLWQVTSLYGQPRLAAEIWVIDNPTSMRAAQFLAQRYILENDTPGAVRFLDEAATKITNPGLIQLQALQLACYDQTEPNEFLQQRLAIVLKNLPTSEAAFAALPTFEKLLSIRDSGKCAEVFTDDALIQLGKALFENPQFLAEARNKTEAHLFLATLFTDRHDLVQAKHHLDAALELNPALETINNVVSILNCPGQYEEGLKILESHTPNLARNPWLRHLQQETYAQLIREQRALIEQNKKANNKPWGTFQ